MVAASHRRANFIQMTKDRTALDYLNTRYTDIKFALKAVKKITISDAFESNLPGIAYNLWGDPDYGYWWVLGLYNGIVDPLSDLPTGTDLLIPSIDDVKKYLQSSAEEGIAPISNVVTL